MKKLYLVISSCALAALLAQAVWAASFDWEKAVSLSKQGQYRAAITEFQSVLNEFPDHADSWKFVGLAYFQLKEYDSAVMPLEKALALKQAKGESDLDILQALGRVEI